MDIVEGRFKAINDGKNMIVYHICMKIETKKNCNKNNLIKYASKKFYIPLKYQNIMF